MENPDGLTANDCTNAEATFAPKLSESKASKPELRTKKMDHWNTLKEKYCSIVIGV